MTLFYVYILTNKRNTVLYIGITNNLARRMYEHKNKLVSGFTSRYNVDKLVWFEQFNEPQYAIEAEKKIKGWKRFKKEQLISIHNPQRRDLSLDHI